jgi:hypothetical protein
MTENLDMPVFFPFGRPGDFLADKPRSTEDLVRKLYGDEVEFREIPQSVTYTEFAAPAADRDKFGPMIFGDFSLSPDELAVMPTQDDLPQPDRKQLIQNSEPAEDLLPPPEMTQDLASMLAAFDSEAAGYIRSGAIRTNTRGRQ